MGEVHSIMTNEQRLQLWRDKLVDAEKIAAEVVRLNLMKKRLNDQRVAIFDEIEANGILRNSFKEILRQRKMDADKRDKFRQSYDEGARACGWSQIDALGYDEADSAKSEADILAEQEIADAAFLAELEQRLEAG